MVKQPFYVPACDLTQGADPSGGSIISYESNVVWLIANFQYITAALAFSVGPPFRKPLYTNIPFVLCAIGFVACSLSFLFVPGYLGKFPPSDVLDEETGEPYCVGDKMKPMHNFFLLVSFVYEENSYYRYRWRIFIAGMINSVVNFAFERIAVSRLEQAFDRRFKNKRAENLRLTTEASQSKAQKSE